MPEAFFYWLKVADSYITGRSDDDAPGSSTERAKYTGKEVTVTDGSDQKEVFKGKVERSLKIMRQSMYERNDPSYCFPAQIKVTVK